MSFSHFLYLFFFLTIAYFFAGHILILRLMRFLRPSQLKLEKGLPGPQDLPSIVAIIPFYNEASFIVGKLNNLLEQDYPKNRLKIIFVDAGSTDESLSLLKQTIIAKNADVLVYNSPLKGKIQQVNHALNFIGQEHFVLITDCDALLGSPLDLQYAVHAFQENPTVGLVGGWTTPQEKSAIHEEVAYWDKQNRMRYLEMKCFSSSIVVAPFYIFRRDLLGHFPQDCIADDVYISLLTHLKGLRVLYLPHIKIEEIRSPQNLKDLLFHKLRKSNAYMTELFRFIYKIPYMGNRLKYIYLARFLQFFYLPWGVMGFGVMVVRMLYLGEFAVLFWSFMAMLAFTLLASVSMAPPPGGKRGGLKLVSMLPTLKIFSLTIFVLFIDFFVYPFWRQNSAYKRLPL